MSDEKNVELGVFEALNALAEEKNASAETRETLRKNVRQSSESQAAPAERRRPGRPKKEKAPELPLDEAIATGLTNLRNAKAKHAPAPKTAAPAVPESEVASALNSLFAAAEKQPVEAVEAPAAQERMAKVEEVAKVEKVGKVETVEKTAKVEEIAKVEKVTAAEKAEEATEEAAETEFVEGEAAAEAEIQVEAEEAAVEQAENTETGSADATPAATDGLS